MNSISNANFLSAELSRPCRVERLPGGRVRVGMKRALSDGTSAMEFSPLERAERLAALLPPSRANQLLRAAVLAGNAASRGEAVPRVQGSDEARQEARASLRLVTPSALTISTSLPRSTGAFGHRHLWTSHSASTRLRVLRTRAPGQRRRLDLSARRVGASDREHCLPPGHVRRPGPPRRRPHLPASGPGRHGAEQAPV